MQNSEASAPLEVQRLEDGSLYIAWGDGHQSTYGGPALRQSCPCAACRDEREAPNPLRVVRPIDPRSVNLVTAEPIGNYALGLVWGDGHRTGIYPYRLLRQLCDCFACRTERG
ncbi:MAG: DUF971 domain-containing protein [Candidatus Eisenbacteria bacterium]|nr:DUF971 domain-containing protein [Candidatus Eisenbacteria bacterium]